MKRIASCLFLPVLFTPFLSTMACAKGRPIIIQAASCNESDVATSIEKATTDGDIVSIPTGTCIWTGTTALSSRTGVIIRNSITIEGAGAEYATNGGASTAGSDQTIIIDDVNHNATHNPADLWLITTYGKSVRITGIAILQNSSSVTSNLSGLIKVTGPSNSVRIDHCHFYQTVRGDDLYIAGNVLGVADHDFFDLPFGLGPTNDIAFYNGESWGGTTGRTDYGDASWADTNHFGTSEFFYAEDDFFSNGGVTDCHYGGRFVVRYSMGSNTMLYSHGLSGDRGRGCRAAEVYNNKFSRSPNYPTPVAVNSGAYLVWDNTATGYAHIVNIDAPRKNNVTYQLSPAPAQWGFCGGAPYATGKATVSASSTHVTGTGFSTSWPSGSMIFVAGASCAVNSRTGDICEISSVQSSTDLTLTTPSTKVVSGASYSVGSPWDGNQTAKGYPCMDGPARGAGDLLNGQYWPNAVNTKTGAQSWPHQTLDPVYVWDNTYNPAGSSRDSIVYDASKMLTDNVDYYQQFGEYGEPGSFNGTKGVGQGLHSEMPSTCTEGVGYWATDVGNWNHSGGGGQGALYICGATGWPSSPSYVPYQYPHPLQTSASITPPTNLKVTSVH